jgi:hypothetical protein
MPLVKYEQGDSVVLQPIRKGIPMLAGKIDSQI